MNPRPQFRLPRALLAIALGVGAANLPAGEPKHEVQIEAVCRDPDRSAKVFSYEIRASRPTHDERSLRYKEAVATLRTALSGLGLFEAPTGVRPDMIIEFDYGLGAPRTIYVETTEPVYEVQGGASCPAGPTTRIPEDARRVWLIGYATVKRPAKIVDKYLAVSARLNPPESAEARAPVELWRVQTRIEDSSTELRGYLPVLAAAVMESAGYTTDGNTALTLAGNSEVVAFVRRGL